MSDKGLRLVAASKGALPQLHHLPFVLPVCGMLRAIDGGMHGIIDKGIIHKGIILRGIILNGIILKHTPAGYYTQVYTCNPRQMRA